MHLIDATNAEAYLREAGHVSPGERVSVRELAGGVSNIVLLVDFPGSERAPFVLKQAREQLRVAQPWFCSPERIWREVEVLRICQTLLADVRPESLRLRMPQVLFEDREHYLFAMEAASADAVTWKQRLMQGDPDQGDRTRPTRVFTRFNEKVAEACGYLLAHLHSRSWQNAAVASQLSDRQYFDALRIDPYYRRIAEVHPRIKSRIADLITSMDGQRRALVHGDFSPKNLLIDASSITLIDCEVGHFGDPMFDVGFFLSHLQLKAIHFAERAEYFEGLCLRFLMSYGKTWENSGVANERWWPRAFAHLRACLLARVDGKSPVEYLSEEERDAVRTLALDWFRESSLKMIDAIGVITLVSRDLAAKKASHK